MADLHNRYIELGLVDEVRDGVPRSKVVLNSSAPPKSRRLRRGGPAWVRPKNASPLPHRAPKAANAPSAATTEQGTSTIPIRDTCSAEGRDPTLFAALNHNSADQRTGHGPVRGQFKPGVPGFAGIRALNSAAAGRLFSTTAPSAPTAAVSGRSQSNAVPLVKQVGRGRHEPRRQPGRDGQYLCRHGGTDPKAGESCSNGRTAV